MSATDRRPKLTLVGGQRTEVLQTIEAALRDPGNVVPGWVFARGFTPAVLRHGADPAKLKSGKNEITLPPRTAYLAPAKPEHVAHLLERLFRFIRFRRGGDGEPVEVPCNCPLDLARHVLANVALLPLVSISRAPVLRDDGSVLDKPGYDALTGIYYAPEEAFPPIPVNPTQADAKAALARLLQPFRGFPFASEADKHAAVGEVLTLLTRHLVPRAPAFLHNATEAGSGKTKLFDTLSTIALGSPAALLNAAILGDETELKKVLTTLTLAAAPLAVFDNVARGGEIRSPGLSNYLTATIYGDRLLGANEEVKAATNTVIGMTGNGCEISGDNTRRIIRIDLDAAVERPELREFDFDFDCEAEARDQRGELVVAALTILRAHALAGWTKVSERGSLGSFEEWDKLVCGAIAYAGGPDVLTLLEKTRTVDPERSRLAEVLGVLVGVSALGVSMSAGQIVRAVETAPVQREGEEKAGAQEWRDTLGRFGKDGVPSAKALGRYLTRNKGRVVDGMTLLAEVDMHTKQNVFRVTMPKTEQPTQTEPAGFAGLSGIICGQSLSDVSGERLNTDMVSTGENPAKHRKPRNQPEGPDDRGWLAIFAKAGGSTERRDVVLRWVRAFGGAVHNGSRLTVTIPSSRGRTQAEVLALRELHRVVHSVGIEVTS